MIRFLRSSVFAFLIVGCSPAFKKGLVEVPSSVSEIKNPYFSNPQEDYVYKAKIDVYGNYLGGILIIKNQTKPQDTIETHRVVFTTEFGSKLFDFLYEGDAFTKNFAVDKLDKKLIINTLKNDFKILISGTIKTAIKLENNAALIYKSNDFKRDTYYFYEKETQELHKIINASSSKEKITFTFAKTTNQIAEEVRINHSNIKLTIDLQHLKKD